MTTITDTLTYIDGSLANGRLVVGWKPFTVGNVNAAGGELEWSIVDGAVSISLYSNTGAQPTGSYYVAKYELENGAVYLEQWMVPDLPTVNLGQVRVAFPPSPSVMISPLQLTSLGAAPGMFLTWNGQRWVPGYPASFSFVDPTLVKGDIIVRGDTVPATRLGVGADGWTLIADSSQPLGIKWIAPVSGFADPTTTKGDLIVRGNAGTTRIGAGSNAFVLTADSTVPLGLKWAAAPLSLSAGSTGQVQYNSAGAFGASANLFWDITNSRLGIGTTSPVSLLSVGGPGSGNGVFAVTGGSTSGINTAGIGLIATYSGENLILGLLDGGYAWIQALKPSVAYRPLVLNPNGGNVGIGTTSPNKTLEVFNAAATTVNAIFGNSSGAVALINNGNVGGVQGYTSTTAASSANLTLQSGGGNVGIGTTSPGAKLTIGGGDIQVQLGGSVQWLPPNNAYDFEAKSVQANGGYSLIFGFANYGAVPLVITYQSRIGINNQAPGYALDVAGDVNTTTVYRVQGSPCARVIAYLDQTGARALNTVYQNTQLSALFVAVTLTINAGQFAQLLTDIGNPPTNVICAQTNPSGSTVNQTCNGWVMPNQYYKINAPSATLIKWFEWQ